MKTKNKPWQVFTLAVITTLVAELFFGTTPVSRAFLLIPQLLFYGSASILIREIARRQKLPWISIVLLGIAFAWLEEGLTLQSFFNPNFIGTDLTYGRIAGINLPWTIYSTGYHASWSICISLLLTETIFRKTAAEPWIGKTGLWVFGILFLLICFGLHNQFKKMSGFNSPLMLSLMALLIVIALILIALKQSPADHVTTNQPETKPSGWLIGLSFFLLGTAWLLAMFIHYLLPQLSPVIDICIAPVIVIIAVILFRYWKNPSQWTDTNKCALVIGMIAAELLLGYFMTQSNPVDHIGHIVIMIIVLPLLVRLMMKRKNLVMRED